MIETSRSNRLIVIGLIAVHLAITLPLAWQLNIWADEGSTMYTTQNGFMHAFQFALSDEKQAPLYFWVLSLWRSINSSIFFARLFSVICSMIAIKVFANLAVQLFKSRTAMLVTAFFALHPFLIWASLEIRVYSLVILISVLLIRSFADRFGPDAGPASDKLTSAKSIIFLLLSIVALYTNYYLGFILVGLFAALLIQLRWRDAFRYLIFMAVAAAAFLPILLVVGSQLSANTSGFQEDRTLFEGMRFLWHHVLTFFLPTEIFPDDQQTMVSVARIWIVRVGLGVFIVAAVARFQNISRRTLIFGAITFSTAVCFLTAYFVLGFIYVEIRHASVLFVPLILFIASALADITGEREERGKVARIGVPVAALVILSAFSYSIWSLYPTGNKRGDWGRVGTFIEQNEKPNQPILVFTTFDALSLPYHYHGVNRILPDEKFFDFQLEAEFGSEKSHARQTEFAFSEVPAGTDEFWLVVNEKCLITRACVPLENFVNANYTVIKEQDFYREKVRLLKKKPQ